MSAKLTTTNQGISVVTPIDYHQIWRGGGGGAVRGVPSLPSENADIAQVVVVVGTENCRVGNLPEPGGRYQVTVIGSTTL